MSEEGTKENNQNVKIIDMTFIISTIICLLPILFGVFKWNELPDQIPTHWGLDGNPDSYSSKAIAVFLIPIMCGVINIVSQLIWNVQKKKGIYKEGEKLEKAIKWLIPLISLVVNFIIYTFALGKGVNVTMIVGLLVGFVFIVIGNYTPKTTQNKSHRFGLNFEDSDEISEKIKRPLGFIMVILGLIIAGFSFTSFEPYVILLSIVLYVILCLILVIRASSKLKKR